MSVICEDCKHETNRYVTKFFGDRAKTTCFVCEHPPAQSHNVGSRFSELVLDHVTGDDGKPLRITSIHQLRAAEKKYKFRSVVGNEDECNFDKPPQTNQRSIAEQMTAENKWLFPEIAKPMLREMERNGELMPVSGRR